MAWQMPPQGQWGASMPMTPDMNMGGYTADQWTAMQQQNWQQWAQWQQQYAQWQSQYGEKYAQQMQAMQSMGSMPPLPPTNAPPPAPPPPDQPPPPPHENNQPLYGAPPTTKAPGPVPPPSQNQSQNRTNPNLANVNTASGKDQWSYGAEASASSVASSVTSTVDSDALKKLAEEEKLFDIQFQKWEEEIEKWRRENVNHPDKEAYNEYEQKFEACRAQLLERRQQMKQKRARLTGNALPTSTPMTGNAPTAAPPQNTSNNNYSQHQSQNYNNNKRDQKQYNQNVYEQKQQYNNAPTSQSYSKGNVDPQDRYESYEDVDDYSGNDNNYESESSNFLPTSAASKGIPGLDLVPDTERAPAVQPEVIDITEEQAEQYQQSHQTPKGPDYTIISKGINNILGDEKIMNILSMVRSQPPPTVNSPVPNSGNMPAHSSGHNNQYNNQSNQNSQWDRNDNYNQQQGNRPNNMPHNKRQESNYSQQNQGNFQQNQGSFQQNQSQYQQHQGKFQQNQSHFQPNQGQVQQNQSQFHPNQGQLQQNQGQFQKNQGQFQQNQGQFQQNQGQFQQNQGQFQQNQGRFQQNQGQFQQNQSSFQQNQGQFNRYPPPQNQNQMTNERQSNTQNQYYDENSQQGRQDMPQKNNQLPPRQNAEPPKPLMELNVQHIPNNFSRPPPDRGMPETAQPPNLPRQKWVEEPLFTPSIIVEYDHKALRLKARDFIEPVHMFDYNHKSKDGENKKRDFEREADEMFTRKPRREREDFMSQDRYTRDQYSRDYERRLPREDIRDDYHYRMPRDDYEDRRRPDDRYDDRRRDDRYARRDDSYRERERERERDRERERERDKDFYRDRFRDVGRKDERPRSSSNERDNRKRDHSRDSHSAEPSKKLKEEEHSEKPGQPKHIVMIDDLLESPGREMRPEKIVIILRGLPGSGKSYLAKLIRDKEAEYGGTARIMSIDDYFMHEGEVEEKDPTTGKIIKKPTLKYEYDESLEESYLTSLKRAFKRSLTDGYFTFLIFDAVNSTLKSYADIWNLARQNGFQVYVCTMEMDVNTCHKRNIHNRSLEDVQVIFTRFFPTPAHHIQLDPTTLLQSAAITDVHMEDAEEDDVVIMEDAQETEVESVFTSKWEKMDDAAQLARLDGTSKPLRSSHLSMEDYLQLDDWKPNTAQPGKKTVRWADIEERRQQEKMRAIGFVVGQTDWNRMTDPTMGSSALTQTKYIERVKRT